MATIAEAVRSFLLADATIAGLVGTRFYPGQKPQDAPLPAIVYDEDAAPIHDLGGDSGATEIQLDLQVFGASKGSVAHVTDAIRARCASAVGVTALGRTFTVSFERAASGLIPSVAGSEAGTHQVAVTLDVIHSTGA